MRTKILRKIGERNISSRRFIKRKAKENINRNINSFLIKKKYIYIIRVLLELIEEIA